MAAFLFWSDAIVLAACRHSAAHAGPQREALSTAVLGRRGQSWRAHADRAQGISLHLPIHIRVHHLCGIGFSGPAASASEVVSPGTRVGTDRKSVVEGQGGSVRVNPGGRRIIKKK